MSVFLLLFCKRKKNSRIFSFLVIVKASSGPRYVVGCRVKLDKAKLVQGTRVTLDMTTLTIMRMVCLFTPLCKPLALSSSLTKSALLLR